MLRACDKCASSKRKCNHNHDLGTSGTTSGIIENYGNSMLVAIDEDESTVIDPYTSDFSDYMFSSATDLFARPESSATLNPENQGIPDKEELAMDSDCGVLGDVCSWMDPDETTFFTHQPQSPELLSAILFVETITHEGVSDSWFGQVPSRIGHDACLDLSIAALQMNCWYKRGLPGATLPKCYRAVAAALEAVKFALANEESRPSEHTLASVAALSPVDAIRLGHTLLVPSHLDGLTAILVSRAAQGPLSELALRIMDYHFCDTYILACVRGQRSRFEELDKSYCKRARPSSPMSEVTLRTIGNELSINLPKLIALVRSACDLDTNSLKVFTALSLAEELLQLKDDIAESEFLHLVSVRKTGRPTDARITKFSFQFKSAASFEAAAYYWHTRAAIFRLCLRLRACFLTLYDTCSLPTIHEIEAELQRLNSNLLMLCDFAWTLRSRKRKRLFAHSMLVCWGIVNDCPNAFPPSVESPAELRDWFLLNFNVSLTGQQAVLTELDMNQAAELFVGGPAIGEYKRLYDPS